MDIYTEYAKTREQLKLLADRSKELEEKILEEIKELSSPMKNEYGTFTKVRRTIIKLSPEAIKEQEVLKVEIKTITSPYLNLIKEIETRDIESGNATKEEVVGLRFTEIKPEP